MRRLAIAALIVLMPFAVGGALSAHAAPTPLRTSLPLLVIDGPAAIPDAKRATARLRVVNKGSGRLNSPGDAATGFAGPIGIEIRGTSSSTWPKKSYSFETRKPNGKGKAVALLGLPKESDWVLYASYNDKTLMRNVIASWTARRLGAYASRTRFVEVVLNGRYRGVYVLMEKPKIDKARVDVGGDDATGGYLVETMAGKKLKPGDGFFRTPVTGRVVVYADPKPNRLTPARKAAIRADVTAFERALHGDEFRDPKRGYRAQLDVPAAVDYVLLNEFFKNQDAFASSTFLNRAPGGKLRFGPVWDFDVSMGNSNFGHSGVLAGWIMPARPWASRLYQDPTFTRLMIDRWRQLRGRGLIEEILRQVDANAASLRVPQSRNFAHWRVLGRWVWPNARDPRTRAVPESYAAEVAALKSWLVRRAAWIDANLESLRPQ